MARKFDIVVFGATGFTGKHVVKELVGIANEIKNIKWSVAGRSRNKLQNVLDWVSSETGKDTSGIDMIEADVKDSKSLESMAKQSKLILNLVGPYDFYGEAVVKACIENGCHHLDLCGEVQWLDRMVLDYHDKAKAAGVYIIQSCGFDSIPAEMGVIFTKREFPGILNSVESYMSAETGPAGFSIHFGTFDSIINAVANFREVDRVTRKLNRSPLPKMSPKLTSKKAIFYSSDNDAWSAPFPGPDVLNLKRTRHYLYETNGERPIQCASYLSRNSLLSVLGVVFGVGFLVLMSLFNCGRKLLTKYPEFFTMGMFSHKGPTKEQMEESSFQFKFFGKGFSSKEAEARKQVDMKIVTACTGPDPGYVGTSIAMVQAGLTVLHETEKLPKDGGVFSPGAAFANTNLIQNCSDHGVKFTVIKRAEKI